MVNRKWMWILLWAVMFFIVFSPMAYGDLYWEKTVVSGGAPAFLPKNMPKEVQDQIMSQFKSTTEIERGYLTSYGSRTEQKGEITIMEFDTLTVYQLNPLEKTYTKINMKAAMEGMGQMVKEMTADSRITATDETKEIAGYTCRKYIVTMMGAENEHWLSKEVEGYKEFKAIGDKILKKNPKLGQMSMGGLSGEEGFPVKTVNNIMGMSVTTTLKKIEKRSLSRDLFKVPAGYKLLELKMPIQ
jgi:hypothetical protein